MDVIKKFEHIVENSQRDKIIPFLKNLDTKERRSLMPAIKRLDKYYNEYIQEKNTYSTRGKKDERKILSISFFVCATKSEYFKLGWAWLNKDEIHEIFDFYIPEWFGEYINERILKNEFPAFQMDYDWMMELKSKGILNPVPELIIRILPEYLFDRFKNGQHFSYTRNDKKLIIYPETLQEHIWLFFEMESALHLSGRYLFSDDNKIKDELSWHQAFVNLSNANFIDRNRLLNSSIGTVNMNFNKAIVGWFIDLFVKLEPTEDELLKMQPELIATFSSSQSKPVNVILNYLKNICTHEKFNYSDFLNNSQLLLSNETKTIVNSTLIILEKIAKNKTKTQIEISIKSVQALIHTDSSIQKRSAKLIAKIGNVKNKELISEIQSYNEVLLSETREILCDYLSDCEVKNTEDAYETEVKVFDIESSSTISYPDNIDDLIFLASQAFDNNDSLHFEIFPVALYNLKDKINEENADKFEPALQRAFKIIFGDFRRNQGLLDHMLAMFFVNISELLIMKYPDHTKNMKALYTNYENEDEKRRKEHKAQGLTFYPLYRWTEANKIQVYKPVHQRLVEILELFKSNYDLPLISSPTHQPYWLSPKVLIERLAEWQKAGIEPKHADLQIAISRTNIQHNDNYNAMAENYLTGELKNLVIFLLSKDHKPKQPFTQIAHWWTAYLSTGEFKPYKEFQQFIYSKENLQKYTADYEWDAISETFQNSRYSWENNSFKTIKFDDTRKILKFRYIHTEEKKSFLKDIFKKIIKPKTNEEMMLYDYLNLDYKKYETQPSDIKRFYSLYPNYPEKLLFEVIRESMIYPESWSETDKKTVILLLEQQLINSRKFGLMSHLFLVGTITSADETIRSIAVELFISSLKSNYINKEILGKYLGKYFLVPFVPLKRFTDILQQSVIGHSQKLDTELINIMEICFKNMGDNSVSGLKKLLELYYELISKYKHKPSEAVKSKIKKWDTSKSISTLTHKICNN